MEATDGNESLKNKINNLERELHQLKHELQQNNFVSYNSNNENDNNNNNNNNLTRNTEEAGPKENDIIKLNIAGKKTSCSRSTLTQFSETLLASMFSGRWEGSLKKDEEGCVFLDYQADCFFIILDWLRSAKMKASLTMMPPPLHHKQQAGDFEALVRYLGLSEVMMTQQELELSLIEIGARENKSALTSTPSNARLLAASTEPVFMSVAEQLMHGQYKITLLIKGHVLIWAEHHQHTATTKKKMADVLRQLGASPKRFLICSYKDLAKDVCFEVDCVTMTCTASVNNTPCGEPFQLQGHSPWTLYIAALPHSFCRYQINNSHELLSSA